MSRHGTLRRLRSWCHDRLWLPPDGYPLTSRDALSERLATLPLFLRCSTDELRTICKAVDVLTVRPGTVLSSPSHRPNPLVLMIDGEAVAMTDDGVSDVLDGSMHGAAEELAGLLRPDQVVTSTDAVVLLLEPRRLLPLLEDCPVFALSLMRQLARQGCAA